jgi:hypothetical protein
MISEVFNSQGELIFEIWLVASDGEKKSDRLLICFPYCLFSCLLFQQIDQIIG